MDLSRRQRLSLSIAILLVETLVAWALGWRSVAGMSVLLLAVGVVQLLLPNASPTLVAMGAFGVFYLAFGILLLVFSALLWHGDGWDRSFALVLLGLGAALVPAALMFLWKAAQRRAEADESAGT